MFVSISAFLLCLVSEVSRGEEVAYFLAFLPLLGGFIANFSAIKNLFPKI